MKKALKDNKKLFYFLNGKRIEGCPEGLTVDISKTWGNATGIFGNGSNVSGDISGLVDDISGLSGCATGVYCDKNGVSGMSCNLDECELTDADRRRGVNIKDLL